MTAAYHLSRLGHEVCLFDFPAFPTQIQAVRDAGGIEAVSEIKGCDMLFAGFEKISLATHDMEQAMAFSDFYVMICPSFAQEMFFKEMIPYLRDGITLLTMPGNYASLVFEEMLRAAEREDLALCLVDSISIPWACRLTEPGKVGIMGLKEFLPVSVSLTGNTLCCETGRVDGSTADGRMEQAKAQVEQILPIPVEILPNPLVAGLENINFGGHPLMTIVNIGLLENFPGQFNYYKDCCSKATANAAAKMDLERLAVGKALGFDLRTELEAMNALYGCQETSVYDFNRKSVAHGKVNSAPDSAKARYISEDVPYILVPVHELAALCDIPVPLVDACITIASAYNDEDYLKTGRTLAKMGLAGLSLEELKKRF